MSIAMSNTGADMPLWRKALPVVIILTVLGLAGYGLSTLMGSGGTGAKKQVVKIAVLPDTPPPPPPPKEEKKPEPPKEEPKQVMPTEQPKVVDTPPPQQAETLKMEGAAGDGPSAFSAGSVKSDYSGQQIGAGGVAQPKVVDRAKFKYYANSARQMLRAELDKSLPPELLNLGARLRIWVNEGGAITRFEVDGLNDKASDEKLRQAMEAVSRTYRLAPPADMPQPLELRLSVNPVSG